MESPIVTLTHASKSFVDGKDTHHVLEGVDFALATGASVALTGASGSGKSTLLNIIAGFEPLSGGELWLDGENTSNWKDPQWSRFRHQKLGVIFQQFNLLTPLNVKQNIAFPLHLNQQKWSDWCDYLVDALGISDLLERHVSALSGGQQQRVAIARALAHKPKLLLCRRTHRQPRPQSRFRSNEAAERNHHTRQHCCAFGHAQLGMCQLYADKIDVR